MGTISAEGLDDELVKRFDLLAVSKYGMRGKKSAIEAAVKMWTEEIEGRQTQHKLVSQCFPYLKPVGRKGDGYSMICDACGLMYVLNREAD